MTRVAVNGAIELGLPACVAAVRSLLGAGQWARRWMYDPAHRRPA